MRPSCRKVIPDTEVSAARPGCYIDTIADYFDYLHLSRDTLSVLESLHHAKSRQRYE